MVVLQIANCSRENWNSGVVPSTTVFQQQFSLQLSDDFPLNHRDGRKAKVLSLWFIHCYEYLYIGSLPLNPVPFSALNPVPFSAFSPPETIFGPALA